MNNVFLLRFLLSLIFDALERCLLSFLSFLWFRNFFFLIKLSCSATWMLYFYIYVLCVRMLGGNFRRWENKTENWILMFDWYPIPAIYDFNQYPMRKRNGWNVCALRSSAKWFMRRKVDCKERKLIFIYSHSALTEGHWLYLLRRVQRFGHISGGYK